MITVSKHPRGLRVSGEGTSDELALIRRCRDELDDADVIWHRGSLIAPLEIAGEVFLALGENAKWCTELEQFARSHADTHISQEQARLEVSEALSHPYEALRGYPRIDKLDAHQVAAAAAISAKSLAGIAIFDEQGVGKTIAALAGFDRLHQLGLLDRLLVVAPKSVINSWRGDAESFLGDSYSVRVYDGSIAARRRTLREPYQILLISYDLLARDANNVSVALSLSKHRHMLAVDESYYVKNSATARARAIAQIRPLCDRAIVLCGTPAPNSPVDIVNQINVTDRGYAMGHRTFSVDRDQAQGEVGRALERAIYLRRLKADVFPEMPSKTVDLVNIELMPIQANMYEKARREMILSIRTVDDREFRKNLSSFLARALTLLQICSHPGAIDPLYGETPAKLLALDRLMSDIVDKQKLKVVIWSYFRYSLDAIHRRFEGRGIARIDGSITSTDVRYQEIKRFQSDPETRIFLGNAAAAGAGITLTAAHHAIYESFSLQAAQYMQSVDRIHRRGQTAEVTSHVLLGSDTFEEREFTRILDKEKSGRRLLGDSHVEPLTRRKFLDLLGDDPAETS